MLTEIHSIIDEYLENFSKFTIDMINNVQALSDLFINPNFEEGLIKKLFKKDAWLLVAKQIDQKVISSICPVCSEICSKNRFNVISLQIGIISYIPEKKKFKRYERSAGSK